ncbi:hypothetical protein IWQ61_005037 [Dispira simplex]|nr:hypothetical protein IWQ61_005037 [Dispira simplex]
MTSVVRAIYDFKGQGPSSLVFKRGDIIQVLAKLESGWWKGVNRGKRGWFPSNYVEPHHAEHFPATGDEQATVVASHTASETTSSQPPTTPTTAVIPTTPITAEFTEYRNPGSNLTVSTTAHPSLDAAAIVNEGAKKTPLVSQSFNGGDTVSASTVVPKTLPPGWGVRKLPDGRVYFYHMVTDLTVWSLDGVDPNTGVRIVSPTNGIQAPPSPTDAAIPEGQRRHSGASTDSQSSLSPGAGGSPWAFNLQHRNTPRTHGLPVSLNPGYFGDNAAHQPLTWERLSANIVYAIQQLTAAAKRDAKYEYLILTLQVVAAVHTMFRASDTVERDVPVFRSQKLLKAHHRQVTNTLCKLVLLAKQASMVWPLPDATQTMVCHANDLLLAMRHFVIAAEDSNVKLQMVDGPADPGLPNSPRGGIGSMTRSMLGEGNPNGSVMSTMSDSSQSHGYEDIISARQLRHVDIMYQLETSVHGLAKALTLLIRHLKRPEVSLVRVVTLAKKSVQEVGQFLLIMEELDLELAGESLARRFHKHKHTLYSDLASLVMSVQTASREEDVSGTLTSRVLEHANALNNAVYDVLLVAKHVLEVMDQHEETLLQSTIEKLRSHSPNSSFVDLGAQPRRVQSMPYLREPGAEERLVHDRHLSAYEYSAYRMPNRLRSSSSLLKAGIYRDHGIGRHPEADGGDNDSFMGGRRSKFQSIGSQTSATPTWISTGGGSVAVTPDPGDTDSEDNYTTNNRSMSTINQRMKLKKFFGDDAIPTTLSRLMGGNSGNNGEVAPGQPMGLPHSNSTESKLAKFFGEQAPLVSPGARTVDEKPWYLEYEYDRGDLIFNMEMQVKGGTMPALVERLTAHDVSDINFCNTFLLTYRSFTTTNEFLELLIKRFTIQPPPGLRPDELNIWNERKLKPVRVRVYNIIKMWLESHYVEDTDMDGLRMLREFACTVMTDTMPSAAEQVVKSIDRRRQSSDGVFKKLVRNLPKQAPQPILPRNFRKLRVFDIDALELARQFTIKDSKLFNKIKSAECLDNAWMSKDPTRAPNMKAMVEISDRLSRFVSGTILSEPEPRKRGNIIKYFIIVADRCRGLNNFNSLMSILGGIEMGAVQRLKRAWDTVGTRSIAMLEDLKGLMSTSMNCARYRQELHSCNPPCIPFLGTHCKDLVFVEDGNPDFLLNHPRLINFDKRSRTANVIRELQSYQNTPYALTVVPEIQEFIDKSLEDVLDLAGLYDVSYSLEPREREDEKIARLLRESGFL